MTERIERKARESGTQIAGRIRYDQSITKAQLQARTVVETDASSAEDIRKVWQTLNI